MKNFIFRALKGASAGFPPETDEPIRAELFSVERLEQHAESLAEAQHITTRPGSGRHLAKRLRDNGRVLLEAYSATIKAIREERAITPAAEWLIDNFYVAQEQIREIRDDLPRGFYRGLPKLAEGPLRGLPARFRGCLGVRRAHRQPLRAADAVPVRTGLSARAASDDRRTLGGRDYAANRAGGKFAALGRRGSSSDRAARQEADALADRLLGVGGREAEAPEIALRGFDQDTVADGLCGSVGSAFARSGSEGDTGAHLAGRTSGSPWERLPTRSSARNIRDRAR